VVLREVFSIYKSKAEPNSKAKPQPREKAGGHEGKVKRIFAAGMNFHRRVADAFLKQALSHDTLC
jgi:hypothetical protein